MYLPSPKIICVEEERVCTQQEEWKLVLEVENYLSETVICDHFKDVESATECGKERQFNSDFIFYYLQAM